tara:strand:- start:462 stop:569 length:108 start_codon:yes stop_codon:yes gene_type:complete
MPKGKGTYGKAVGRPKKKRNGAKKTMTRRTGGRRY